MSKIDKLTELFAEFPGIGPRQASRFVYSLLRRGNSYRNELATLIQELGVHSSQCKQCFRFFESNGSTTCSLCSAPNRERKTLMVVEKDSDLSAIEKSHVYDGMYFVLGGTLTVLEKEPEKRIRINALKERITTDDSIKEIILAFSLTPQGEHTLEYVQNALRGLGSSHIITTLGRGVSTGTELEYIDSETMGNALKNRNNT